jgi:hypothetical protein
MRRCALLTRTRSSERARNPARIKNCGMLSYFLRIPVFVFPIVLTASFAVLLVKEGPDDEPAVFGLVSLALRLFPVPPWLKALPVFGPDDPPVPLVLPLDSVFPEPEPVVPPEPAAPPPLSPRNSRRFVRARKNSCRAARLEPLR